MSSSKLEYLRKYMEGGEESKKKKVRKVKRVQKNTNVKIFDANVDLKDVKAGSDSDDPAAEEIREDAPEVAEVIDDRPLEMRSFKKTFQDVSSRKSDGSDSDNENLPRRRNRRDSSDDESPPCRSAKAKRRDSSDESPPRRASGRRDSSVDSRSNRKSGGKRSRREDSDESPPRRRRDGKTSSGKSSDIDSPPRRPRRPVTGDREIVQCEVIDGPVSLRRNEKKEDQAAAKKEQAEKEARRKAIYDKWQAGIVQQQQKQAQVEDILHEASKPLARAADDADLDDRLRAVEREEDPMLAMLTKKKKSNAGPSRPRYNGPQPPPNRYNIWPGYRWDGVDRSNGFESKMMSMKNEKLANEEQAYKWSIEDM